MIRFEMRLCPLSRDRFSCWQIANAPIEEAINNGKS